MKSDSQVNLIAVIVVVVERKEWNRLGLGFQGARRPNIGCPSAFMAVDFASTGNHDIRGSPHVDNGHHIL